LSTYQRRTPGNSAYPSNAAVIMVPLSTCVRFVGALPYVPEVHAPDLTAGLAPDTNGWPNGCRSLLEQRHYLSQSVLCTFDGRAACAMLAHAMRLACPAPGMAAGITPNYLPECV